MFKKILLLKFSFYFHNIHGQSFLVQQGTSCLMISEFCLPYVDDMLVSLCRGLQLWKEYVFKTILKFFSSLEDQK